jgi:SNF2 family DNA or RNA helicase
MPRVSLLLADDVGLGKTVEAGLILTELLLHRRVRRVLVLSPASLRQQWQEEMRDKFSLGFDVVDREETHALQKRLGLDANPWRTFPRIVASYHYLKQPDVLERFRAACRQPEGSSLLPWDLLIVDEAHNLTPSNFGHDSDLCEMLRLISPWFEHKLFLTATPHNGHTRSFSGLLELLDPVRFTQTSEFTAAERKRVEEVVIRRLKREINEADAHARRPPRFGERSLDPVPLFFGPRERALSAAFGDFRTALRSAVAAARRADQIAGTFAVEVLNAWPKRR